jgi:hypothetical protein
MITLAIVEIVIDMAIETLRPVIPRPGADEYAARKPLRPVIAIWSAAVGRRLVVSIRANRGNPEPDRHARWSTAYHQNTYTDCRNTQPE